LAARIANREALVVDVRDDSEWELGHVPGALHIPLGRLASRIGEIPRSGAIVVQCQGGNRSAIAASVLLRHGIDGVTNLSGGFTDWVSEGQAVAHD
jgi:hydroxyacylglutathione hydrolase